MTSRWAQWATSLLAWVIRRIPSKEIRQFRANVGAVLGLPAQSGFATLFERQCTAHQIRCSVDTLRATLRPDSIQWIGQEELAACAQQAGGPVGPIFITAHVGSWELCAQQAALAANKELYVLAKPQSHRLATLVLNWLRRRMGVRVLWTTGSGTIREMVQVLRRGDCLGFVMDQKPERRIGPKVEFFSRRTEFVSGPASLATKYDCGIVSLFCVRRGPSQFQILSRVMLESGHGLKDVNQVTQLLASEIERVIRLYPEQWTWNYKRWKEIEA